MFTELSITSNFSFLTGGSHPEEYMDRAAILGLPAIAIADENSVAGIVRAHTRAREIARQVKVITEGDFIGPQRPGMSAWAPKPVMIDNRPRSSDRSERLAAGDEPNDMSAAIRNVPRLIPGARIVLADGVSVTMLPRDRVAWGRLCRLLTVGRRRAEKGSCILYLDDLLEWGAGSVLLIHPQAALRVKRGASGWGQAAQALTRRFGDDCFLVMAPTYDGHDRARFDRLAKTARDLGIPTVASAQPIMHHGNRRKMTDVLTAIRSGCRIEELGRAALANSEQRLRSEADMLRLFAGHEAAVERSGEIAASLTFSLDELRYEYPSEVAEGENASERLRRLSYD
ncbi:MAG: error-prone DNA polymerase, partial [Pseudomonadota bacterium]